MGPGGPLTTFRDHEPLAAFFEGLAGPREPPTELILAGDVFDFLQAPGYAGFEPPRAPAHFETILTNPATRHVMRALARFARGAGHEITLLSGNHDPELLLPSVRERFEDEIGCRGRVRYADDEALVPRKQDSPPVCGRALGTDAQQVCVVHGDRWDAVNAIERDRLREAGAQGHSSAELPTGSQLVYKVLSRVKPGNPWVDELKPEFPAVLLLLLYLDGAATAAFLRQHLGLSAQLLREQIKGLLHAGPLFGPEPEGGRAEPPQLAGLLAYGLGHEPAARHELLLAQLAAVMEGRLTPAVAGTLAEHGGVGRWLLRAWLAGIRRADRFQQLDGPDDLPRSAEPTFDANVVALVAGHTHGARIRPIPLPAYFNTGTWVPVARVPEGDVAALIDGLEAAGRWPAEAPRTFVEVQWGDGRPSVRLGRCDARGVPALVRT